MISGVPVSVAFQTTFCMKKHKKMMLFDTNSNAKRALV
jgi:hypothetical protein